MLFSSSFPKIKKPLVLSLKKAPETKDCCPTRYHSDFMNDFTHLWDTESRFLYPSRCNGRVPSVSTLLDTEDFGQPLRGEFHTSSPLPRTARQLSGFESACTIPHHRIFFCNWNDHNKNSRPCQDGSPNIYLPTSRSATSRCPHRRNARHPRRNLSASRASPSRSSSVAPRSRHTSRS